MSVAEILLAIVQLLVPAVATYLAVQLAKAKVEYVDTLSPVIKQILAVVVGVVFTKLSVVFGVTFPPDLQGLTDPAILGGVLAGVLSWVIHKVFAPQAA